MSDQQLNSLDRFRKQSTRLLLEEHSSCEVPAGCGGLLMRWRDPQAARPLTIRIYTASEVATTWLDGQPLQRGYLDVRPGKHILAVHLENADRHRGLLMAALRGFPEEPTHQAPPGINEVAISVLSAGDGTWKATCETLPENWLALDFDDRVWEALVEHAIPEVSYRERGGSQWHACDAANAHGLALGSVLGDESRGSVWVRKVFDVPVP
jgi:hypothetical protein